MNNDIQRILFLDCIHYTTLKPANDVTEDTLTNQRSLHTNHLQNIQGEKMLFAVYMN